MGKKREFTQTTLGGAAGTGRPSAIPSPGMIPVTTAKKTRPDWNAPKKPEQKSASKSAASYTQPRTQPILPDALTGVTPETAAALTASYTPSDAVTAAQTAYDAVLAQEPDDGWLEPYMAALSRDPFRYDPTADPMYIGLRGEYERLGSRAMEDAIGRAASLTGGYASSYAEQAGQRAYENYLSGLAGELPALYDRAYDRWQDEGAAAEAAYDRAYEAQRDLRRDWEARRDAAQDALTDAEELSRREFDAMRDYFLQLAKLENSDAQWRLAFAAAH